MRICCVKTMRPASEFIPKAFYGSTPDHYSILTPPQALRNFQDYNLFIIYGFLRGCGDVIRRCIKESKDFIYMDHPYFEDKRDFYKTHPLDSYWFRCTLNAMQPSFRFRSFDRWENLFNYEIKDWKEHTGKILVIPPSDHTMHYEGVTDWLPNAVRNIKGYNYIIRERSSKVPLQQHLDECFHMVTYHSLAAVEALRQGLSVTVERCSALSVASSESPLKKNHFNRVELFSYLAYSQFRVDEIKSGYALNTILGDRN